MRDPRMNTMNAFKLNWRGGLITMGVAFIAIALFMVYIALMPLIDGVYTLDSKALLERYVLKNYQDGELYFDEAAELGWFSVVEDKEEITYMVWELVGDGYTVLYCSGNALEASGKVHVQAMYQELSPQVIAKFAPNVPNVFVLYDAGSPAPYFAALGFFIIAGVVLLMIAFKKFGKYEPPVLVDGTLY